MDATDEDFNDLINYDTDNNPPLQQESDRPSTTSVPVPPENDDLITPEQDEFNTNRFRRYLIQFHLDRENAHPSYALYDGSPLSDEENAMWAHVSGLHDAYMANPALQIGPEDAEVERQWGEIAADFDRQGAELTWFTVGASEIARMDGDEGEEEDAQSEEDEGEEEDVQGSPIGDVERGDVEWGGEGEKECRRATPPMVMSPYIGAGEHASNNAPCTANDTALQQAMLTANSAFWGSRGGRANASLKGTKAPAERQLEQTGGKRR